MPEPPIWQHDTTPPFVPELGATREISVEIFAVYDPVLRAWQLVLDETQQQRMRARADEQAAAFARQAPPPPVDLRIVAEQPPLSTEFDATGLCAMLLAWTPATPEPFDGQWIVEIADSAAGRPALRVLSVESRITCIHVELQPGTAYFARVRGCARGQIGAPSNALDFVTPRS